MSKIRAKYFVKEGCEAKCSKKCTEKFSQAHREKINEEFWTKSWRERRLFIQSCSDLLISKRKIKENFQRKQKKTFFLQTANGDKVQICKVFLLTTLGFKKTNDRVLYNSLNDKRTDISEINDRRGKHKKPFIIDREVLKSHVESFQPKPSLYCLEQEYVPHYLPSNITIKYMYDDIRIKYPNMKISYDLYRKNLKTLNISFTHLGNEVQEEKPIQKIQEIPPPIYHPPQLHNLCNNAHEVKMYPEHAPSHTSHFTPVHLIQSDQYLRQTFQTPQEQPYNNYQNLMVPQQTVEQIPQPVIEPHLPVQYTKNGTIRRRKKYDLSVEERVAMKKNRIRSKYLVKEGCDPKCTTKCTENFSQEYREQINKEFWEMSWSERRFFIKNSSDLINSKRRIKGKEKRQHRKTFSMTAEDGERIKVCKVFLLTTLGFKKNNDRVLYNSLKDSRANVSEMCDGRGRYTKTPTVNRDILKHHVESFQPKLSPYTELTPMKRYLPSDITVKSMYNDFREKYPHMKVSYDLYRKNVKALNISFTRRGEEDCQLYGAFEMHWAEVPHSQNTMQVLPTSCMK